MAPAGPRLVLSEERVRARSGLAAHRDLAELQSLSIPGTYQEKITHLGNSLMNLTGLKSLDLSRNSLVSLEGIQYLIMLESLNLYYNCISSLAEVFRLYSLTELTDVDFRLNPVVKNESDYRLFVVHMLPKLRQLDDRPVRESERKASQLHFAPEESLDSKHGSPAALKVGRPHRSRRTCPDSVSQKCPVLDADDEAVLNLIAECEWGLSNPPGSASSSQKEQESEFHSSRGEPGALLNFRPAQHQGGDSMEKGQAWRRGSLQRRFPERSPHCGDPLPRSGDQPDAQHACLPHPHGPPHADSPGAEDLASSQKSSLLVPRAAEKHRKRRMPSSWFQEPRGQACPSCLGRPDGPLSPKDRLSRRDSTGSRSEAAAEEARAHGVSSTRELHAEAPSGPRAALEDAFLEALLSLVSRHGDGCRSLLGDEAFLAQARLLLSSVQAFTATRDSSVVNEEISYLTLENKSLQSHLVEQQQQQQAKVSELMAQLSMSRRELDDSRKRLERSLEENSSLKSLLFSMKKDVGNAGASATLSLQLSGLQASVEKLSGETAELKQHLEHHDKIQELIQMLQESHSSLVSTNEHLLEELGQVRAQHKAEVEQLHWSYKELKKTLALFPPGSPNPGAHARPGPLPH